MHRIERQPYGFRITFRSFVHGDEVMRFAADMGKQLVTAPAPFGMLVDLRSLKPLLLNAQQEMKIAHAALRAKGVVRVAAVVSDAVVLRQYRQISIESDADRYTRYFDAKDLDWEVRSFAWLKDAQEPSPT